MISEKSPEEMSDECLREWMLESKRAAYYNHMPSRLQCVFSAYSLKDAIYFAKSVKPRPDIDINIFEVKSNNHAILDMNWLDYKCDPETTRHYQSRYWMGDITNHQPKPGAGPRRSPKMEVLLQLPVEVGRLVKTVRRGKN